MKINIFYAWSLGLVLFMCACSNNTSTQQAAGQPKTESEGDEHGSAIPVQLNNGAAWEANAETTQGITNMKKLVSEFPASPTQQDYTSLKVKLVSELNLIFQRCTMTGDAHTQLHHYLIPLKEMIEVLGKSSVEESGQVRDQISNKLAEYDQYFK